MSSHEVPNVILLQDNDDANTVVAGVLTMKGCRVHKTTTAESCLSTINQLKDRTDAILMNKEITITEKLFILNNIKKINPSTKILIVEDDTKEEDILHNYIDEFIVTPTSAENLADRILMLIAKKELKRIRENQLLEDEIL